MVTPRRLFHPVVRACRTAILAIGLTSAPSAAVFAQNAPDFGGLFAQLAQKDGEGWRIAETDILREWSRSGSPAMDALLKRGEAALDQGDAQAAIGHLTALTDHAPDFAAGFYARAVAYAQTGETGPALADLERTLVLEPRHFAALTLLGSLFEEMGADDHARAAYRASLAIHPHQAEAVDAMARLDKSDTGTDI